MKQNLRIVPALLAFFLLPGFAKAQQTWEVGMRSGTMLEVAQGKYYDVPGKQTTLTFSQQLFVERHLGRRFHMEMGITFYHLNADLTGEKTNALGKYYDKYEVSKLVFMHRILAFYTPYDRNRLRLSAGTGFGINSTLNHYDMRITNNNGPEDKDNAVFNFEGLNIYLAANASYRVGKKISVTAQASTFALTYSGLHGYNFGIGASYRL